MEWPGAVGSSYISQSLVADQEHTINLIWEPMESQGAISRWALYPMPGVESIATASNSPGRGHIFADGREFAIHGSALTEIDQAGNQTARGTVATNANPANLAWNGDGGGELFITSGGNGYCYDLATNVLTQIAGLNGKATMCRFLHGYFIVLDANTSTMYISDLLDGLTWDPTQFAQRSAAADPWISLEVPGEYIWLLGEQTSEVWFDAGTSPFPFQKHPSGLIPYGIKSPFSVTVADGTVVWLDATSQGERVVRRSAGFSPEAVSTYPQQYAFAGYVVVTDAQADVLNWLGHVLYILTFPSEDITWVLDLNTQRWVQWGTWISQNNIFTIWRPRWHVMAFGEHRMLDAETGGIYRLSLTTRTDVDSRPIRALRRFPGLSYENKRITYPGLELEMQRGIGTVTGQGEDPQVMLRLSRDGGRTWGAEMSRSMGKVGEYSKRIRWERLGQARHLVAEVSWTDPVPAALMNAYLTPDPVGLPQRRAA